MYTDQTKIRLGDQVLEYIIQLQTNLNEKLGEQLEETINTNNGKVKISSFQDQGQLDLNFKTIKLHDMLSGQSFLISGKIQQMIMEDIDGNCQKNTTIEINFIDTEVRYNSENNVFELPNIINISYISKL